MKKLLREPVIFDGRNLYEPDDMQELGFVYHSVGRAAVGEQRADDGLAGANRAR
jgi:UDPglucose 6-dehydrogenase